MRLFGRKTAPEQRATETAADLIPRRDQAYRAGQIVTADTALRMSSVWACRDLIARVISNLPVDQIKYVPGGLRQHVEDPRPVVKSPSALVTQDDWVYQCTQSMLGRGNAYGLVTTVGSDGWPARIEWMPPSHVTVHRKNWLDPPAYKLAGVELDAQSVVHGRRWVMPGEVVGLSPIEYAASTVGANLAAQRYVGEWYTQGGHPTVMLSSDQPIPNDDVAQKVKDRWIQATTGEHVAVVGAGLSVETVQITPAEAAWLDVTNAQSVDIARIYGVPPEMIGAAPHNASSVTYANRAERAVDFLVFSIAPWVRKIETLWSSLLPDGMVVKLNTDALLQLDPKSKVEMYERLIYIGVRNRNEIRAYDDQPPIPGGDEYLWPPRGASTTAGAVP